jgi:nucleotide-binding universal stress UspA family protein
MFNKIMFATTASPSCDHAARVAFNMASIYDSNLSVFHVIGIPSRGFSSDIIDSRTGERVTYDEDYIQWVKEEMKNTYGKLMETTSKCTLETIAGIPHTEITRYARKNNIDLIVMGARSEDEESESSTFRKYAGKTLQAVAKSARCPVLVVGRPAASFWGGFSNIVFATDFSKSADSAFMFAYKISKALGCKLHTFHALDISSIDSGKIVEQNEIDENLRGVRNRIRKKYGPRLEELDEYEIGVWDGIPYVEIVKYARENYADLVVMAHHTREPDPEKAKLGSTLEQVVLRAACPVASVNRPDKIKDM